MKKALSFALVSFFALALSFVPILAADTDGFTSVMTAPPDVIERNNYESTVGYEFVCKEDITIYALGRPGALTTDHNIHIWELELDDPSRELLAMATVSPDSPLDALGFRTAMLAAPLELKTGRVYAITTNEYNGGDLWRDTEAGSIFTSDSVVSIVQGRYGHDGVLDAYPQFTWGDCFVGMTFYYELSNPPVSVASIADENEPVASEDAPDDSPANVVPPALVVDAPKTGDALPLFVLVAALFAGAVLCISKKSKA